MINLMQNIINLFRNKKVRQFAINTNNYTNLYNTDENFSEDFYLNLEKTINWTESIIKQSETNSKIDYSLVLRSMNPIYKGKPFYTFRDLSYLSNAASPPELCFNYKSVLDDIMRYRDKTFLTHNNVKELGKILKFQIDITTLDGAPCAESGFVDEADIPPIDTWFYVTKKYLYCWIPTMFIEKMQDAIDVECLESYSWLETSNPNLNQNALLSMQSSG